MATDAEAVQIRERTDDDLSQLVAVTERVHERDGYPMFIPDGGLRAFLTRPASHAAWVAVRGSAIVGHVALNTTTSRSVMDLVAGRGEERPAIYVARLVVDPSARRFGVGRLLLAQARDAALDGGYLPVLDVVDTANAAPASRCTAMTAGPSSVASPSTSPTPKPTSWSSAGRSDDRCTLLAWEPPLRTCWSRCWRYRSASAMTLLPS